ncbi:MAG: hypothetical protein ACRDSH_08115 [Pseudonocardiaceae bacterium]
MLGKRPLAQLPGRLHGEPADPEMVTMVVEQRAQSGVSELLDVLRAAVSKSESRARAEQIELLTSRRSLTWEVLPPLLPRPRPSSPRAPSDHPRFG